MEKTLFWWKKCKKVVIQKTEKEGISLRQFLQNLIANDVQGKEQYHVEISYTYAALENSQAEVDFNSAWETVKENITFWTKESVMQDLNFSRL